jgi:hypothetical protein
MIENLNLFGSYMLLIRLMILLFSHYFRILSTKKMDATLLGYTFQLINVEHLKNEEILNKIKLIAENENRFVRNITQKLLAKYER